MSSLSTISKRAVALRGLKQGEAKAIVQEIKSVVCDWCDYADEVGVDPVRRDQIFGTLRVGG